MNTQELRLGNLFDYEQTTHKVTLIRDGYFKSKWLKDDKFEYTHRARNGKYICASYLKITHEQLLKLGFTYRKISMGAGLYRSECYYMDTNKFDFIIYLTSNGITLNSQFDRKEIFYNYIHELQNLYYSLTKEELVYENKN